MQKSIPWHSSCFQPNICGHALVIYVFIYFVEIHLTMFVICNIITNPFHSIPLFLEQKEITKYRCSGNVILVFQFRRNAFHILNEQDSLCIWNWEKEYFASLGYNVSSNLPVLQKFSLKNNQWRAEFKHRILAWRLLFKKLSSCTETFDGRCSWHW